MPLSKGDLLGPYQILAPIGAGGMGEVFKATDTRLGRIVALKVSKAEFSERFEREARAISSLNHPHICQLYDVGPNYLVMEYIEGAPLKGPLPLDKVLEYAGQIASALAAAHTKKITHRDLKPANILVTKSAGVKLLDFGLAKIGKPVSVDADATLTMGLTAQGTILGTLLYMSPEQIQGKEADACSDIFSFGLVLYEMLTGKRAFDGATPASVMGAILERPAPSITDVAPVALNRVLKRCLEKDPENRWQSARDLQAGLELVSPEVAPPVTVNPLPSPQRRPSASWIAAVVATLAALTLAAIHFREQPPPAPEPLRFQLVPQAGQTYDGSFALSPDGRSFAYIASGADGVPHIWVRALNTIDAKLFAEVNVTSDLAWSPDSRSLAFVSAGKLKRADAIGGAVENLADVTFGSRRLAWGLGEILVDQPVVAVAAAGGTLREINTKGASALAAFLPDGKHFLNWGDAAIWVNTLDGSQPRKRLRDLPQSNISYAPIAGESGGYILFMQDEAIMAQRFLPDKLELIGDPINVVNGVARGGSSAGYFSVSNTNVLAYRAGTRARNSTFFTQEGKVLASFPGQSSIALAPDASKAAIQSTNGDDILVVDLLHNTTSRFTFEPGRESNAVWSPDGAQIAYAADHDKTRDIFVKASNGSGSATLLFESSQNKSPHQWTRDYLLFSSQDPKTGLDLWVLRLNGDRKAIPILQTPFEEGQGQISPDQRWLAYISNESGRRELYVRSFPEGAGKWQISSNGASQPRWSHDGRKLFFRTASGLNVVEVSPGSAFQYGAPKPLFDPQGAGSSGGTNPYYDVAPDGRLLVTTFAPETTSGPVTLVLNWQAGLKK